MYIYIFISRDQFTQSESPRCSDRITVEGMYLFIYFLFGVTRLYHNLLFGVTRQQSFFRAHTQSASNNAT